MLSPRRLSPRARRRVLLFLGALGLLLRPDPARAQAPPNYVTVLAGSTVAYRPPGGSWDGYQHDLTLTAGYGRYVTNALALELDLGPTWVRGDYLSFSLVPALVWSYDPHAYLAARFIVPVDPEANFALAPGVGVIHTFPSGVAPYPEVNVVSYVGGGIPTWAST